MTVPTIEVSFDERLPIQNADGTAHITYFDKRTQASFTWDGRTERIDVAYGGYGEPVAEQIFVSRFDHQLEYPENLLDEFAKICRIHAAAQPDYEKRDL